MKIVFSILFLIVFKLSGLCQSTQFFKTYDYDSLSYPVLNSLIEVNNRFYINGNLRNTPNTKIFLVKTNNLGDVIDTAIFGADTGGYIIENFIVLNNSNLLLLSQHQNSLGIYKQYMLYIDTSLVMYNDSLYSIDYSLFFGHCRLKNSYYFIGPTWYDDNGDSLINLNIIFWKTDTNFNTTSTKSIGTINPDAASTIQLGFDNNLLIGAVSLPDGSHQDWYLINTDTTGQVVGQYFFGTLNHSSYDGIKSITLSQDSCYFITGMSYNFYDNPQFPAIACVKKLDGQFNVLWSKQIGAGIIAVLVAKMISTSDNKQILLTQRAPQGFTSKIFTEVTKFSNNGDIMWSRDYYQGDTSQYFRYRAWDITGTSDKGYVFCGSAIDTANVGPYQQAWLVKTDSLGCDGLRSCSDTALVVEILNYPDTLCQNDTNFVEVRIKGRSAPYSLYANSTMVLDSIYYPYTLPLWIDTTIMVFPTDTGWQPLIVTLYEPWERMAGDTVQVYVVHCPTTFASQDFYKRKVEIFPNPASTELHVKIRGVISGAYTIMLYDIQGKPIRSITTKETETILDISQLPVGVYGVKVIGNGVYRMEKVVKL